MTIDLSEIVSFRALKHMKENMRRFLTSSLP